MKPTIDCGAMMARWKQETDGDNLQFMADALGVSAQSLAFLNVAWANDLSWVNPEWTGQAFVFPMYDATCPDGSNPCGIRLRTMEGKKFAVTGSKAGVFLPYGAFAQGSPLRVFICEGPTDTAACLDLGLFAIGRAACRGGEDIVLSVLNQLQPDDCVLVSDNDGPGVAGANDLMEKIKIPKTLFVPPGKDLRRFVGDGGTRILLEDMLKNFSK